MAWKHLASYSHLKISWAVALEPDNSGIRECLERLVCSCLVITKLAGNCSQVYIQSSSHLLNCILGQKRPESKKSGRF
jgi:hypothetical protein